MKVKTDYLIYCDESCPLEYEKITLLGAIECPYDKKEEIVKNLRDPKKKHFLNSRYETKWVKISNKKVDYYKQLIDYFYKTEDINIRVLIAKDKDRLNTIHSDSNSYQEWYYEMYYYLLQKFIDPNYSYYLLYDEKDKYTTYKMNNIKNILKDKKSFHSEKQFNFKIKQINSKESELMQLLDTIMGAIGYKNRGYLNKEDGKGQAKKEIVRYLEKTFSKDVSIATKPLETKLNIFIWEPREEGKQWNQ